VAKKESVIERHNFGLVYKLIIYNTKVK